MATTTQIKGRMCQKIDTEANWTKATNFIPKKGEICIYAPDSTYTEPRIKVGDGSKNIISLPFCSAEPQALTEEEINAICNTSVQLASEVEF